MTVGDGFKLPHFETRAEAWAWIAQEYHDYVFNDTEWVEDMIAAMLDTGEAS